MAYESGIFTPDLDCVTTVGTTPPTQATCADEVDHAMLLVGYGHDKATGLDYWSVHPAPPFFSCVPPALPARFHVLTHPHSTTTKQDPQEHVVDDLGRKWVHAAPAQHGPCDLWHLLSGGLPHRRRAGLCGAGRQRLGRRRCHGRWREAERGAEHHRGLCWALSVVVCVCCSVLEEAVARFTRPSRSLPWRE